MSKTKKTKKTIVDKDRLFSEIEKTRQRGYAACGEEYLPGLVTIGARTDHLSASLAQRAGRRPRAGGTSLDYHDR
ncbi:MAG: hypothetical protein GY850_39940 [bacterium]|nr:hypothetical protein [bacterium]